MHVGKTNGEKKNTKKKKRHKHVFPSSFIHSTYIAYSMYELKPKRAKKAKKSEGKPSVRWEIITWMVRWWRRYNSLTATLAPIILERLSSTQSKANSEYHKNEPTHNKYNYNAKKYEKHFLLKCKTIIEFFVTFVKVSIGKCNRTEIEVIVIKTRKIIVIHCEQTRFTE